MDINNLKESSFNVLGKNSIFKGEIYLEGLIRVSSTIEGKVNLSDSSRITIEKFGNINGELNAQFIEIYGYFNGVLKCGGKLIIHTGANVTGTIETQDLVIYPGAIVNINGQTL